MDVFNDSEVIVSSIDRFLEVYQELVRDEWVIQFVPDGWRLVNANAIDTFDDVLFLPVSMQVPSRSRSPDSIRTRSRSRSPISIPSTVERSLSPVSIRSRSRSPISITSTEEFRSRSVSPYSISSLESMHESGIRWYRMPMTPPPPYPPSPIRSPSPEPEKEWEIPQRLFDGSAPLMTDFRKCNICLSEEVFPNVMWDCGHMNCQGCVLGMVRQDNRTECPLCCPLCRSGTRFVVGILD